MWEDATSVNLVVADDGRGVRPDELNRRRAEGHVGLALLAARAQDGGGELTIRSAPGRGTRVQLEVAR